MTIEQGATDAAVRIGPVPAHFSWKWRVLGALCGLFLAVPAFAHGKPWAGLLWLVIGCANLVSPFVLGFWTRSLGVYLTPEAAVIHGRRRRTVPWLQVQAVLSHVNSNGTSAVQLVLENGEQVTLPFPKSLWRKGDALYEGDLQRIDQWWLAHRGESWRPSRQEESQPPDQG
jgi:hypothetical protein